MAPTPVNLPPPGFYQAVASIFAVLLLSGVITELRALGGVEEGENRALSRADHVRLSLFTLMCLLLLAGEVVTLDVLVDPPVRQWQHAIISVALLVGLLAVPSMAFTQVWQRLSPRARTPALIGGIAALGVALATIGVLVVSAGEFGIGSFNVPKLFATRVYGTCANGHCGLHMHTLPDANAPRIGTLADGTGVFIVCQSLGMTFTSGGTASRVWDRLTRGGWVSDLYLATPETGRLSRGIRRC